MTIKRNTRNIKSNKQHVIWNFDSIFRSEKVIYFSSTSVFVTFCFRQSHFMKCEHELGHCNELTTKYVKQ